MKRLVAILALLFCTTGLFGEDFLALVANGSPEEVQAALDAGAKINDSDEDGIPDGWLKKYYPGKKANDRNKEGYTYLELYLNSLVAHLMGNEQNEITENQLMQPTAVKRIVVDQKRAWRFLYTAGGNRCGESFRPRIYHPYFREGRDLL